MRSGKLNTKFLLWSAIVLGAFWPIGIMVDRPLLHQVLNTVAAALSVGVLVTFFPAFMRLAKLEGKWSEPHWYMLGSLSLIIAIFGRFVWAWLVRYLENPAWMQNNILLAFLTYLAIVAFSAKLMARKLFDAENEGSKSLGFVAAGAMFTVLAVLLLTGGL